MLDQRLAAVAACVRPGARVADIGTDHAYVPVELVQSGRCPSAIACDLRSGPLENARRTVQEAGLEDRISCRLGDGLAPVLAGEVEDIVVAGMGGETIAAILDTCPWVRDPSLHLVFQPMTRAEELRRYLLTHGYVIEQERTVSQGERLYVVMTARWEDCPPETDEAMWYIGKLQGEKDRKWLLWQVHVLRQRLRGAIASGGSEEQARVAAIIKRLEKMLDGTSS